MDYRASRTPSVRRPVARPAGRRQTPSTYKGRRWIFVALIIVVGLAMSAFVLPAATKAVSGFGKSVHVCVAALTNADASTIKEDWQKGEMPYLYQTDSAWADASYAGSTIEDAGCGPTALSMVYIELTGKQNLGPKKLARWSEEHGYVEAGATRWALMSEGAQQLGLHSVELQNDEQQVIDCLSTGEPVVCIMGPGDFTDTGHFIGLWKNRGDSLVEIRDPNSPSNSHKDWDLSLILSQCRGLWAFTEDEGRS